MKKTCTILLLSFLMLGSAKAQTRIDSLFMGGDTTAIMDSLMADFDDYLDSISKRKSLFFVGLGAGTGYFSFDNKNSVYISTEQKLIVSPTVGYFHRSGFGLSAVAFGVSNDSRLNFYQFAISPSYDLISRKVSTGIAYSHYFTKDSLDFYTTPIHDEVYTYFSYKGWWLRPTLSFSFGWGSKTDYEQQKYRLWSRQLQRMQDYFITVKNVESVKDYSVTFSVRKDFDWYDVFGKGDNFTLTPVLLLYAGTQQFGFNTSYSYTFNPVRVNSLPSNSSVNDKTSFAPQSLGAVLRASYMKGKFLVQPQVLFDYYLQYTDTDRLNTVFSVNFSLAF